MEKPLAEFLSETSEWHAIWFGFYNAFFRLRTEKLSEELQKDIKNEYHYYTLGFFLARIVQAGLVSAGIIFWP